MCYPNAKLRVNAEKHAKFHVFYNISNFSQFLELFSKFCLGRTLNEVHIFNPWNRVSPSVILYLNMYFELILSKSENFAHEKFCELLIQKNTIIFNESNFT